MNSEIYKYFGLVSMGLIWAAIGTLLFTWRGDKSMSISKHAAAHKTAAMFFGGVLIVAAVMFVAFIVGWFIPVLELPSFTYELIYFIGFLYLVGAVVPDTKGWAHFVHYWAAIVGAWLLMPILLLAALSSKVPDVTKYIITLSLAACFAIWVYVKLLKKGKSHFLYWQIGYFAAFHLAILVPTLFT
jgi:hypothetical protein